MAQEESHLTFNPVLFIALHRTPQAPQPSNNKVPRLHILYEDRNVSEINRTPYLGLFQCVFQVIVGFPLRLD